MGELDRAAARRWIARWDAQQQGYMPDREERFTALVDAVEEVAGRDRLLVLDLGCGPGSLAVRVLERLPEAEVVAIDLDPLLLALGASAHGDRPGLRFADLDLRTPGWAARLGLDRPADVAVSTTALHWLRPGALRGVYAELATVLRPGGVLLNGDQFVGDRESSPTLAGLCRALVAREEHRRFPVEHPEDWTTWWAAATADPALAAPAGERERRGLSEDHHASESVLLAEHVEALEAAGFTEIGTIWQHGDNRILCAVRTA